MLQFFKKAAKDRYFYFGALICYSVFVLSVKMHERYAFPAVLLLLGAYAVSKKRCILHIYGLISALLFVNTSHVLFYYKPETYYSTNFHNITIIFGILSLIVLLLWWVITLKKHKEPNTIDYKTEFPVARNYSITKKDIFTMVIITAIYSAVALFNLGDTKAPQSYAVINQEETIDLGKENDIYDLKLYNGFYELSENRQLSFSFLDENIIVLYSVLWR